MQLPDELNKWPVIAEAVSPVAAFALTTVQPAVGVEFFTTSIRRDPRTASDHCAAALDVANDVRNSGIEGRDALRAAIAPLAKAEEHEDAERVARVTAIVVKSINGLADALKGRLSGDIVGILAAAAGGAGGGERSRRVHRRLSNAAALLRASPHLAADVVLVQQKADFDLNSRAGAAVSLPAAVAFGFVDDDVHNDLVTTVERTLVATTEWEIRDALFPCATAPIRTPAYKRCLDGVRIVVEACLGGEVASQSAEHATAVALASIARGFGHQQFAAFVAAAASLPAHLPPTGRHGAAWLAARSVLGRDLDAGLVADHLVTLGADLGRVALLCLVTRTHVGSAVCCSPSMSLAATSPLACGDATILPVDCIAACASGCQELTHFEPSGANEWSSTESVPLARELCARLVSSTDTSSQREREPVRARLALETIRKLKNLPASLLTSEWVFLP